jgi:hypothetical protein
LKQSCFPVAPVFRGATYPGASVIFAWFPHWAAEADSKYTMWKKVS